MDKFNKRKDLIGIVKDSRRLLAWTQKVINSKCLTQSKQPQIRNPNYFQFYFRRHTMCLGFYGNTKTSHC